MKKSWKILWVGFGLVLALSSIATAEIMSVTGDIQEVNQVRDAFEGGSEDNQFIRAFDEVQDIFLSGRFDVDFPNTGTIDSVDDLRPATILVDAEVSSHFLHSDPVGTSLREYSGCITFRDEVIGVMLLDDELDNSDRQFGLSSVNYQIDQFRGFGFPSTTRSSFDELEVSDNRKTVCVTLRTRFEVDQVRIITSPLGSSAIDFVDGSGNNGSRNGNGNGNSGSQFDTSNNCSGIDDADFDILPGNRDNTIHVDSTGKTPIALFSHRDFDAPGCIDTGSLTFGATGDENTLMGCGSWDIDMDGDDDLQCDFVTNDTNFMKGDKKGFMRGFTNSGDDVMFMDHVTIHEARRGTHICSLDGVRMLNLGHRMFFTASGTGIEEIRVQVFNIQGQAVLDSGYRAGKTLAWNKRFSNGQALANGVYFYIVSVQGVDNQIVRSEIKKFVVLR